MKGLARLALEAIGSVLLFAVCVGVFWTFAAAIMWAAGRILPLGGQGRRRD